METDLITVRNVHQSSEQEYRGWNGYQVIGRKWCLTTSYYGYCTVVFKLDTLLLTSLTYIYINRWEESTMKSLANGQDGIDCEVSSRVIQGWNSFYNCVRQTDGMERIGYEVSNRGSEWL